MEAVDPKYSSFFTLISGKLFRIPEYQRPYSWEKAQRDDLFADIVKMSNKNETHFMATVVCLKTSEAVLVGSDELIVYEIVDGQQRMTTLIALLKAIELELAKSKNDGLAEAAKVQNELLVRGKDKMVLLQTNHDEARLFENYLKNGQRPIKSNLTTRPLKNLDQCIIECEKFVKDWKKDSDLVDLLSKVKNKLGFIFYQLNAEKTVYTVFEVLNSRGLQVNALDKSKSILLGTIYDIYCEDTYSMKNHVDHVKYAWNQVYTLIGLNEIKDDDVVKYAATLLMRKDIAKGKALSLEDSLEVFRELSQDSIDQIKNICDTLVAVAKYLKQLKAIPHFRCFNSISQVRFLYVAIYLNGTIQEKDLEEVIWNWEKISFKIYGLLRRDARNNVGDYIRLGRDIFHMEIENPYNQNTNLSDYNDFESLELSKKVLARLSLISESAPIDQAADTLKGNNCYDYWEDEFRYLCFKVEQYLNGQDISTAKLDQKWLSIFSDSNIDTIEHIFPQTLNEYWKGKLGKGNRIENVINRIGNLLVLPKELNSECQNKAFYDKVKIYEKASLSIVNQVIYNNDVEERNRKIRDNWDYKSIEEREAYLIDIAKKIWQ